MSKKMDFGPSLPMPKKKAELRFVGPWTADWLVEAVRQLETRLPDLQFDASIQESPGTLTEHYAPWSIQAFRGQQPRVGRSNPANAPEDVHAALLEILGSLADAHRDLLDTIRKCPMRMQSS